MTSGARLAWSSLAFTAALALGLGAAHWYEVPKLAGAPERSLWAEPDFLFSLASGAVALSVAAWARPSALGVGGIATRSPLLRALVWAAFTLFFLGLWGAQLGLLTLLVAPAHGLASARLLGLWRRWRTEALFARTG